MTTPRRDYTIRLYTSDKLNRGRIALDQQIIFYNSDRYTSNIYLIADQELDCEIELIFSRNNNYRVSGNKLESKLIEFVIPYEYLQEIGVHEAQFLLTRDNKTMTTNSFTFTVRSSIMEVK